MSVTYYIAMGHRFWGNESVSDIPILIEDKKTLMEELERATKFVNSLGVTGKIGIGIAVDKVKMDKILKDRVQECIEKEYTLRETCEELYISPSKAYMLGFPRKYVVSQYEEDTVREAFRLLDEGYKRKDIGKKLGVSVNWLYRRGFRCGK